MRKIVFNNLINDLYKTLDCSESEVKAILQCFVQELADFQKCMGEGTSEEIRFKAHKIKGELSIAGMSELSQQVEEIETLATRGLFKPGCAVEFNQNAIRLLEDINCWLQSSGRTIKDSTETFLADSGVDV
jgi:HPt (histidine-containing phosphotransfer) domain-containing protein